MNYYVVIKDNCLSAIYDNWTECETKVKHIKKIKFHKFTEKDDVIKYVLESCPDKNAALIKLKELFPEWDIQAENYVIENIPNTIKKEDNPNLFKPTESYLFVDGSYNKEQENYAYGYCIVVDNKIIFKDGQKGKNKEAAKMFQVSGELEATLNGLEYLIKNHFKAVTIVYDYEGIKAWATKEWKAKNKFTQEYAESMKLLSQKIDIEFLKVKSHLPAKERNFFNNYNEYVDKLAKNAFNNKKQKDI